MMSYIMLCDYNKVLSFENRVEFDREIINCPYHMCIKTQARVVMNGDAEHGNDW